MIKHELDMTGCFSEHGAWIETHSGTRFCVTDPAPETILIADISHALSNICRYGGHARFFYSVAQHCCHVHDYLNELYGDKELAFAGLLHDASEAYLCDVPRPIKPLLEGYAELERKLQARINQRFGVVLHGFAASHIKEADNAVLMAEASVLMASGGTDWQFGDTVAADIAIESWKPRHALLEFMERFNAYVAGLNDQ